MYELLNIRKFVCLPVGRYLIHNLLIKINYFFMFQKLKQFRDLRNKAKTIQSVLAEIKIETESRGVKLVMDGSQKIWKKYFLRYLMIL